MLCFPIVVRGRPAVHIHGPSTVAQWVGLKELVWLGFRFVGGEVVGGLKRMTPFATEIVGWVTFSA